MYKIIGGDGQEYGPITEEQMRLWLREGRVNAQTQVRRESETEWKPLGSLPEFAGADISASAPPPVPHEKISTYLVPAILTTICCCLPLGIPAIVFAAQTSSRIAEGNIAGARESSRKAKMWCWIAFAAGIVSGIIGFFGGLFSSFTSHAAY